MHVYRLDNIQIHNDKNVRPFMSTASNQIKRKYGGLWFALFEPCLRYADCCQSKSLCVYVCVLCVFCVTCITYQTK